MTTILIWVCLALALVAPHAQATTYYANASTGNNSNSCAQAQNPATAKADPMAAVPCLASGDTLHLTGTFTGSTARIYETAVTVPNGTAGNPTIIEGEGAEGCALAHTCSTILRPTSAATNFESASYLTIRKIEFDGTNHASDDSCVRFGGSGEGVGGNIILQDVEVHHCSDQAVFFKPGYSIVLLDRVNLHHAGQAGNLEGHGCYCSGDNTTIQYSSLHDNGLPGSAINSYGAQFFTDEGSPLDKVNNAVVHHNSVYANRGGGIAIDGDDALIYNNLIYGQLEGDGIDTGYSGSLRALIYNNVIYNNPSYGIRVGAFGSGNNSSLINNHVVGNSTNVVIESGTTGVTQTTNRTTGSITDCTVSTSDFSHKSGSLCVDAGTTVGAVTTDYIGTSRPQNGAFDIGAYEYIVSAGGEGGGQLQEPAWSSPRRSPFRIR